MKTLAKIWGISLALILLVSLLVSAVPTSAGTLAWTPVAPVDKQFQPGADCSVVATTPDGNTVYVYNNAVAYLVVSTATAGAAATITVTYVDQGAVGGNVATAIVVPINTVAGTAFPITLAAGDTGIMDLAVAMTSAGASTAGVVEVWQGGVKFGSLNISAGAPGVFTDGIGPLAAANVPAPKLYKSTNGGKSFSSTNIGTTLNGNYVTDMAASSSTVVASTRTQVFRSQNGGASWGQVGDLTAAPVSIAGANTVTSVDVTTHYQGGEAILVGWGDVTTPAATGGVALYTINNLAWDNLTDALGTPPGIGGWPVAVNTARVLDARFSPNHQADAQILVLAVDATDAYIWTVFGNENWSATVVAAKITGHAPTYGVFAFPADYEWSSNNKFLVGTANAADTLDDVYSVSMGLAGGASRAVDAELGGVGTPSNIRSIAINGNWVGGKALVGQFGSTTVKRTADVSTSAISWSSSTKSPYGGAGATDYVNVGAAGGAVYAATVGATSANVSGFYKSTDDGATWNGISMIDCSATLTITKANLRILDFSIVDANNAYVLMRDDSDASGTTTAFDEGMVWKTADAGATWEMLWVQRVPAAATIMSFVQAIDANTVFVAENSTRIWKTTNGGSGWVGLTAPAAITAFKAVDASTYYTGAAAALYKSGRWPPSSTLTAPVQSIVVAPGGTIYIGDNAGSIFSSSDDGATFGPPIGGAAPLGAGNVSLALSADGGTIFAGSTVAGNGTYRWINGVSATWLQMFSTDLGSDNATGGVGTATDTAINSTGVAVAPDGSLYTVSGIAATVAAGMYRSVSPMGPDAVVWKFERASTDMAITSTLNKIQIIPGSNAVYTLVTTAAAGPHGYTTQVMTYKDVLTAPPALSGPATAAITPGTGVTFSWTKVDAPVMLTYTVEVSTDADFANKINAAGAALAAGTAVTTTGTSISFTGLTPGTTYWWRVFVSAPIVSTKTAAATFTPMLSAPNLQSPAYGEDTAILRPTFSWLAVGGADRYIFELCDNPYFLSPIATNDRLMHTTYALDKDLDYATTYYWRVKAVRGAVESPVSESVFTIKEKPVPPVPPVTITQQAPAPTPQITLTSPEVKVIIPETPVTPSPVTPMVIWAIIVIGAILVIAVIVLIVRTRRVP